MPIHRRYADVVRAVADELDAPLCDMAARFEAMAPETRQRLMMGDGIHFLPPGDQRLAELLLDCLWSHADVRSVLQRRI